MKVYIFKRTHNGEPFFYPIELKDDKDAIENARCNPGTTSVEDFSGRVVWIAPENEDKPI